MAVLMTNLRAKSSRFAEIVDSANTTMKTLGLPIVLQYSITDYLTANAEKGDAQEEFETFEGVVPPSFRSKINEVVYERVFENPLFENNHKLAVFVLKKLKNTYFKPEEEIMA
jgi:hypothetical protein